MAWTAPRTWVAGELVTAAMLNTHLRDNLKAIGEHQPGDLLPTYVTHANATSSTLTEPRTGWYIGNGATFVQASHPVLYANLGNTTTLPDYRGRVFVAPGTQDGHAFTRGETGGQYDAIVSFSDTVAAHTHPAGSYQVTLTQGTQAFNQAGAVNPGTYAVTGTSGSGGGDAVSDSDTVVTMPPYRVGGMVLVKNDN